MTRENAIAVWSASEVVKIPASESSPDAIVKYAAPSLSKRDMQSIVQGFKAESYEMVSTFVWTKAAAALKKQVATLGMEFVGEMLARPELDDDSDPATSISDHEAITLAEDLGMITATQAMRLKHALQLVSHFANLDHEQADDESMERNEAIGLLKVCTASILGQPKFSAANQFANFRKALGERSLKESDADVQAVKGSPYFFVRTTISVLLSLVKGGKGATYEHAIGNTMVLLPLLWERLRGPERWQVGQAYAEVNSAGNRLASAGLKKALVEVHGFDYVPESLRSGTFAEAAARVLAAHFAFNNFYKEEEPMSVLAQLGTAIPMPAFAKCMEATLAVWLGNRWGYSFSACSYAGRVLDSLRKTQWEYYLDQCLSRDRTVLDKLANDERPGERWRQLVAKYLADGVVPQDKEIRNLLKVSCGEKGAVTIRAIQDRAEELRKRMSD
jgi:hypothetical protein